MKSQLAEGSLGWSSLGRLFSEESRRGWEHLCRPSRGPTKRLHRETSPKGPSECLLRHPLQTLLSCSLRNKQSTSYFVLYSFCFSNFYFHLFIAHHLGPVMFNTRTLSPTRPHWVQNSHNTHFQFSPLVPDWKLGFSKTLQKVRLPSDWIPDASEGLCGHIYWPSFDRPLIHRLVLSWRESLRLLCWIATEFNSVNSIELD